MDFQRSWSDEAYDNLACLPLRDFAEKMIWTHSPDFIMEAVIFRRRIDLFNWMVAQGYKVKAEYFQIANLEIFARMLVLGMRPLAQAKYELCCNGDLRKLACALSYGVDFSEPWLGRSCLLGAVSCGQTEMVRALLSLGHPPEGMEIAVGHGHQDIIDALNLSM